LGLVRRWRGGRSSLGATVNRLGTDVSVGVAVATEQAAKQAGSLAGTAVSVTGSIVVGGASLMADGVVTLANAATAPSRHVLTRPAPTGRTDSTARPGGRPESGAAKAATKAGGAPPRKRTRPASARASTARRPATSKARRAPKSP
jgi:hypothetical protein